MKRDVRGILESVVSMRRDKDGAKYPDTEKAVSEMLSQADPGINDLDGIYLAEALIALVTDYEKTKGH